MDQEQPVRADSLAGAPVRRGRVRADLAAPLADIVETLRGTVSDNTERALRADLAVFSAWCAEHERQTLPADGETVAAFVEAMAETRAPATVRRYVASIAAAHRAGGDNGPTGDARVKLALQRMYRRRGRRQRQAHGLTRPLLQRMLTATGNRPIDARDRALLAVAYDGLLRRSELAAVDVADLAPTSDGAATLLVRRSKTDQEGHGDAVFLAPDTAGLVVDWLRCAGHMDGRLFRSISNGGAVGASLHPSQIPRIFKALARRAGLPPQVAAGLSGHSARIGAVQDMVASGIELPAILQAGRWKTTAMVNRYGERLLARRNGAAQLARLQRRV